MVGVPIGNDEYVLERAREIVKERATDHLERCLSNMPEKQAAALIVTESLGQRTGYLERALDLFVSFFSRKSIALLTAHARVTHGTRHAEHPS